MPAGGQSVPNDGDYGVWSARREVFDDVALREGAGSRDFPLKGEPGSGAIDASPSTGPRPSQLPDVATYRPDDAGGERDSHPEEDRERDLRHVTSPVVL